MECSPVCRGGDFKGNIPAERVEQDGGHLFVSDTEKSTWNNKAAKDLSNVSLEKLWSNNGYYKAPDGLLLQWGYMTGGDSTGNVTIYFPTTFYAVPYCVITDITTSPSAYLRANMAFLLGDFEVLVVKTYRYIYPLCKHFCYCGKEKPYPQYEKGFELTEWKRDTPKIKRNIIELIDKVAA